MRKRIAVIDKEKCHPLECGNYLCAKLCPVNRGGADCITPSEFDKKALIDEVLCTGCAICPKRCPFGAITIINLPESLNKSPIHRHGENSFELYSLPSPLFGKVTGIVGKNGIGKSTALKIISNMITPNLGQWDKEAVKKEVINYFKGTETQKYLDKLYKDEITLGYKPQQVELIPKSFSGTVRELLEKVDTDGKLDEVSEKLKLGHFLDTPIGNVSGGELQRVAIAAVALKKAELYLFDEPTSYLDIKQRLKMSHFIQSFSDAETAVLVIEHDLIILDFMTDFVNIMYGHPGVYGIVSGIKSTREGINAFLEGHLREENVRFRNHAIKFERGQEKGTAIPQNLVSWDMVEKKLGKFDLKTKRGTLYKNEIVGVLGENGIGKTSFVKLLAGVVESDSGSIEGDVKVAYKSQYLDTESDMLVAEFLVDAVEKYTNQLINPLGVGNLMARKLSQLSGGELQKVSIVHCLSQDADLFLLDEPSAYLDVEQRLAIGKVLRNVIQERDVSVVVVDHDLMFIDTISDRVMVFTGEPAVNGLLQGPFEMVEGMNLFLKELGITLRRDIGSNRPRINKENSVKDREQRSENKWYY